MMAKINKRLKEHRQLCEAILNKWEEIAFRSPAPELPAFHLSLSALRCGARTKATGQPCKRTDTFANGKCKYHGGKSTGPKTVEGKRRSSLNGFKKKRLDKFCENCGTNTVSYQDMYMRM